MIISFVSCTRMNQYIMKLILLTMVETTNSCWDWRRMIPNIHQMSYKELLMKFKLFLYHQFIFPIYRSVIGSRRKGEVFRRNHLIQLAETIKTKRSFVTFLKNEKFLKCYVYPIKFTVLKIFSSTAVIWCYWSSVSMIMFPAS